MNWEAIGVAAEVIGATGVIITLAYLAIQIRQSSRQEIVHGVQESVKEFVNAYATVTNTPDDAQIFRSGLNNFSTLSLNDQTVFHTKMQLVANGFYQVWVMNQRGILEEPDLYRACESLYLSIMVCPGAREWWSSFRELPPKPFRNYMEKIFEEKGAKIKPANQILAWYNNE